MDWITETLLEYGRQIGINDLRADAEGRLRLAFSGGSHLAVEQVTREGQDELLLYWVVPVGYQAGSWVRQALARCHTDGPTRWPVQVGLRGNGPEAVGVVLLRTLARGFTTQSLGQAVDHLRRWLDALRVTA